MYLTVFDRLFDVPKERKNASYKASVYVVFCLCHFFSVHYCSVVHCSLDVHRNCGCNCPVLNCQCLPPQQWLVQTTLCRQ